MKYLAPGSHVVIMSYILGTSTAIDRESGVSDFLQGKAQLTGIFYSSGESDIAYQQAIQILHTEPDVKGIVALNDPTTIGVLFEPLDIVFRTASDSRRRRLALPS